MLGVSTEQDSGIGWQIPNLHSKDPVPPSNPEHWTLAEDDIIESGRSLRRPRAHCRGRGIHRRNAEGISDDYNEKREED